MQPVGKRVVIPKGKSLLEAAQIAGVELTSVCGGIGSCDSCKIRLISGNLSETTLIEKELFSETELKNGYRLACQAYPDGEVKVEIPPESLTTPQRLQIEGDDQYFSPNPVVSIFHLQIQAPSISDLKSDASRLIDALNNHIQLPSLMYDQSVLTTISSKLRDGKWNVVAALRGNKIISIVPINTPQKSNPLFAGIAVDIGTTKLAAYLVNLVTGETLAKTGTINPQIAFGEDVISRISFANRDVEEDVISGRELLQLRLIQSINNLINELRKEAEIENGNISTDQIIDAVVVGNTAMHHLFAGYPVKQLGEAPYVAAVSDSTCITARDIGLDICPGAEIFLPPNIAGYVGADHVAMLLATIFRNNDYANVNKTILALDIGTNTEISLYHDKQIISCSCASGPAFEGAHIQNGMRAAPGAIERVQINPTSIRYKTIGDQPPIGICGSGILDAVSEMLKCSVLDKRGAIINKHPNVVKINAVQSFLLASAAESGHGQDILVTRKDVNEIQLAKGAIRAGIDILLSTLNIDANQIVEFIIAGAFGTYISIESAIRIGMFPQLPLNIFHQVGNAAGAGAKQMLIEKNRRIFSQNLSYQIKYIELSNYPGFANHFAKSLFFPDIG